MYTIHVYNDDCYTAPVGVVNVTTTPATMVPRTPPPSAHHRRRGLQRALPPAGALPVPPGPVEEAVPAGGLGGLLGRGQGQQVEAQPHGGQQRPAAQQDQLRPPAPPRAPLHRGGLRGRGPGAAVPGPRVPLGPVALEGEAEVGLARGGVPGRARGLAGLAAEAAVFVLWMKKDNIFLDIQGYIRITFF